MDKLKIIKLLNRKVKDCDEAYIRNETDDSSKIYIIGYREALHDVIEYIESGEFD